MSEAATYDVHVDRVAKSVRVTCPVVEKKCVIRRDE
eukprot:gene55218-61992_t